MSFLIFLPILLAGISSLSLSALYLKEKTKILSLCRQHLLEIQNQMSSSLANLQKLNPLAKKLRIEAKRLQYLLKISPPIAKPAIIAKLAYVKARQVKLTLKQKFLIKKAEAYATKHLRSLKHKIHGPLLVSSSQVPLTARLAVIASPPTALAPSYHTVWNFTQKQSIQVKWIEQPAHIIPSFLKVFLGSLPSVHGECRSSLRASRSITGDVFQVLNKEGDKKWQSILL